MDTKVDEKLTGVDLFLLQQNTRFRKVGALKKRNGYTAVNPTSLIAAYPSISLVKVVSESDKLLCLPAPATYAPAAYSEFDQKYSIINESITAIDKVMTAELEGEVVANYGLGLYTFNHDYYNGTTAYLYTGASPFNASFAAPTNLVLDLHDDETGFKKSVVVASNARNTQISVKFYVNATGATRICVAFEDPVTPNVCKVLLYDMNLVNFAGTSFAMDTGILSAKTLVIERYAAINGVVIGAKHTTAQRYSLAKINDTGLVALLQAVTTTNILVSGQTDIRIQGDVCYIAYLRDNGAHVYTPRFLSWNLSTNVLVDADRAINTSADAFYDISFDFITTNIIGIAWGRGSYDLADGSFICYCEHTISTSTSTSRLSRLFINMASRLKKLGTIGDGGRTLIGTANDRGMASIVSSGSNNPYHNSYVLAFSVVNNPYNIIGHYNTDVTDWDFSDQNNVNLTEIATNYYSSSALRITSLFDTGFAVASLYRMKIDLRTDSYQKNSVVKFSQSMLISSGTILEYDGTILASNGFYHGCAIAGLNPTAGTGTIPNGVYKFIALYEYVDSNGQRIQSTPSDSFTGTMAGGPGYFTINVAAYTGRKRTASSAVDIVLYMTEASADTYYRVSGQVTIVNETANFTQVQVLSPVSTTAELLYTTGGILSNDPPPPAKYICSHQERLFAVDADYPNQISYTKKSQINSNAQWSSFFKLYLAASDVKRKNNINGLASLNEKLIIFRQSSIYYILGDGPNVLGEQNNFTEPELISSDVGCLETQSIIETPIGVFFKSVKGIYFLDQGLSINYIGEAVESYNDLEIIGAQLIENSNLVYFKTLTNILIYDYQVKRWSVDTIIGIDIAIFNQKTIIMKQANQISFESDAFADVFGVTTSGISQLVETGWIKTTGIQDFGRITYAMILGKYVSPHTLRVDVYYDYDEDVYASYDLTHNPAQEVYQFRIQLNKQKCESIKFKIYDIPVNEGESMELTNLTLELGIKKGVYKTPKTRNY